MASSKTCHPHARGALALLQFRAQRHLFTEMDKGLFAFISHVLVRVSRQIISMNLKELTDTLS